MMIRCIFIALMLFAPVCYAEDGGDECIVEYRIVTWADGYSEELMKACKADCASREIEVAANRLISQGWQPFGGIGDGRQVMVKYGECRRNE